MSVWTAVCAATQFRPGANIFIFAVLWAVIGGIFEEFGNGNSL